MDTIFIVGSPIQYVNAIEYAHSQQFEGSLKMIAVVRNRQILMNVDKVYNLHLWSDAYYFDYNDYNRMPMHKSRRHIYKKIRSSISGSGYRVVVGNFGNDLFYALMQSLKTRCKEIIALDDGIPTINILSSRARKTDYQRYHIGNVKQIIKSFYSYGIFLPIYKPIDKVIFYTIYSELKGSKNDVILHNPLRLLKDKLKDKQLNIGSVYFIGSGIVGRRLISEPDYLNKLRKVKAYYEKMGCHVLYISHRNETKDSISNIEHIFKVCSFDLPIEVALLLLDELPLRFSSFFSSALLSVRTLLTSDILVESFLLKESELSGTDNEPVSDIMEVYDRIRETSNISIITEY